jgi:hypothetical protein
MFRVMRETEPSSGMTSNEVQPGQGALVEADHRRVFTSLSAAERLELEAWQVAARSAGVDGVEDLSARHWPVAVDATVLGIYRAGDEFASWLVVGRDGDWCAASCDDNRVLGSGKSLGAALGLVYRAAV